MSDPSQNQPTSALHGAGHEKTDADVKPIVGFLLGLGLLLILVMVGMTFLFNIFEARYQQAGQNLSPVLDTRQIPPNPRLQANPAQELKQMRLRDEERLNSYGWVDKDTGVFRIPIDRAMELTVENGLPVRPE